MNERLRALLHGRVQGVGCRYSTYERARDLGLTGWVANRLMRHLCGAVGICADFEGFGFLTLVSNLQRPRN